MEASKGNGIFKLTLRDTVVIVTIIIGLLTHYYAIRSSIISMDARSVALEKSNELMGLGLAELRSRLDVICLAQQKLEIEMALTKLQIKNLEAIGP